MSGADNLVNLVNSSFPNLKIFNGNGQNMRELLGSSECLNKTSFDYIAVPLDSCSYFYPKTLDEGGTTDFKGRHGGLSADEMLVPFVIVGE